MRISDWSSDVCSSDLATEETLPIQLEPKVNEYLALLMQMIFAFGLCFQLPVVMTLLARVGLATSKGMAAKRKYAIVGVFIVAAIFTPPDPLSQVSLAVPIIILYEISRSEEHTSELQSLMRISYAVFCLYKQNYYIYL